MNEQLSVTLRDGRTLSYAEYGSANGSPVLFSHGWPSSRLQARFLDEVALEHNVRILAPDRPGIGNSSSKKNRSFIDWAEDVQDFLDSLNIGKLPLYAVSGGSPFAFACSSLLKKRITKMAIVCGAPPLDQSARKKMHFAYRFLGSSKLLRRAVIPILIPTARWMIHRGASQAPMSWVLKSLPPSDRESLTNDIGWDMITRSFLEAAKNGGQDILQEGELYLNEWGFDPTTIKTSVRFWHGIEDANLPFNAAKKLASNIPQAESCWLKNQGHYSISLSTKNEVIEWLK